MEQIKNNIKKNKLFIILLSILYPFNSTQMSNNQKNQIKNTNKNSLAAGKEMQMPMISEEELQEIMQNAVEEYKRLPESEKELMCKNFGIDMKDLDDIMKEAETIVTETSAKKNNSNLFPSNTNENNTFPSTPIAPQPVKSPQKIKQNQNEYQQIINKTILTLQILISKMQDQTIRNSIITNFETAYELIEMTIYYISIIKEYLKNKEDQIPEFKELISICNKINNLYESITKILTYEEYSLTTQSTNLFSKYTIKKNSMSELIQYIEKEINITKTKINKLQEEYEKSQSKEIKKEIFQLEFKLNDLEKDLNETTINETKIIESQIDKYQYLIQESTQIISNTLKKILITEESIKKIEGIIQKNFPEEYKIGKKKEQEIKNQMIKEKKFNEQKGSQGNMIEEKTQKNNDKNPKEESSSENNNFQYQSSESYNDEYGKSNEENEFNFPKEQNPAEKSGRDNKTNSETGSKDNSEIKKEEIETDSLDRKKRTTRNKNSKVKKEKEKELTQLIFELKILENNIIEYLNNNPEDKFHQESIFNLKINIENKIKSIKENMSEINKKTILKKSLNQNLLKEEDKKKDQYQSNSFLKEEKEKIKLLNLDSKTIEINEGQEIIYTMSKLSELLKENFNEKKKQKAYENFMKSSIEELDLLFESIKKKIIKSMKKSENKLPFWLESLETIREDLKQSKKIEKKTNPEIK